MLAIFHRRALDPKAHYNLGVCLDGLGERGAALDSFEKAFELQPSLADAGANAAGLLIQTGEAERACTLCYLVSDVFGVARPTTTHTPFCKEGISLTPK